MESEQPSTERFREVLSSASARLEVLKERIANNEGALRSLESNSGVPSVTWEETRITADRLIAAVTVLEITHGAVASHAASDDSVKQVLDAMPSFTTEDLVEIAARGDQAQFGAINMVQGYLGEEIALEAINAGLVPVPEGRVVTLAPTSNQPGFDLQLHSPTGGVPLTAQVKISESAALVREHLERYPDVSIIYTNTEAADALSTESGLTVLRPGMDFPDAPGTYIVDVGADYETIRDQASDIVLGVDESSLIGKHNIPWIALSIIALRTVHELGVSETPTRDVLTAARRRVGQTILATTAAGGAGFLSNEPLVGPAAAVATLIGADAIRSARASLRFATSRLTRTRQILNRLERGVVQLT